MTEPLHPLNTFFYHRKQTTPPPPPDDLDILPTKKLQPLPSRMALRRMTLAFSRPNN